MSALYAENKVTVAFEAGRKALDYGRQGIYDVHFRDAVAKCVLEANALISGHEDELVGQLAMSFPEDNEVLLNQFERTLDQCESEIPKCGDQEPDLANLDPSTIMLIMSIGKMAWELGRRFGWF